VITSVCPEVRIFEVCAYLFEMKACEKNYRRRPEGSALGVHMSDIGVSSSIRLPSRIIF
jgi:hypothetical protein